MGKGINGALLTVLGAKTYELEVTGTTPINDRLLRVHCRSADLLNPEGESPGDWLRCWFPDATNPRRLFQRAYTLFNVDPAQGTFDLIFVQHQPLGPAAAWAAACRPGDRIEATRYSGKQFKLLDPAPQGYLFLGDLASWPAITELVRSIPQTVPVEALLVAREAVDETVPLPEGSNVTARWIPEQADGMSLAEPLAGRDFAGWYAWVCSETTETRHARTLLRRDHHLGRADLHAQAYWIRGKAMGTTQKTD